MGPLMNLGVDVLRFALCIVMRFYLMRIVTRDLSSRTKSSTNSLMWHCVGGGGCRNGIEHKYLLRTRRYALLVMHFDAGVIR